MKKYLSTILALALSTCTVPAYPDAVIFSGNDVKALKANLDLNGQAKVMSGTVDPTSVATSAPIGSIYLNTTNGNTYRKLDTGSSTNWQVVGSAGSSGINYISNAGIETAITGYSAYADAAGASPVDGTGGAPSSTVARTTTSGEFLRGVASAKWTKSAANRQGEGFSYDIKVDPQDNTGGSKAIIVQFDYLVSGTYVDDDMQLFAYDKDGATVIGVMSGQTNESGKIKNCTGKPCKFTGVFYTVSGNDDYRLIWHTASTSASAYNLFIDNVRAGPEQIIPGAILGPWTSCTATGSWITNTTYTCLKRRNGELTDYQIKAATSGAPTATNLLLTLPTGDVIDTTKLIDSTVGLGELPNASGSAIDAGNNGHAITVAYQTTGSVAIMRDIVGGAGLLGDPILTGNGVSNTAPFTFGSGDSVVANFSVPIVGQAASAALTTTEAMLTAVKVEATRSSSAQSISTGNTDTLVFDTEITDNLNAYNPSTGEFTAPKPGSYFVSANFYSATQTAFATNERLIMYIFKNGVQQKAIAIKSDGSQSQTGVDGSSLVTLVKGDVVTVRLFQDSGATQSTFTSSGLTNLAVFEVPDFSIFSVFGTTDLLSSSSALTNYVITVGQHGDLTSISLPPGEWDLDGQANFYSNGATTTTDIGLGISTTSGNSTAGMTAGDNLLYSVKNTTNGSSNPITVSKRGIVVTSTTTYYLKGHAATSITNLQVGYKITARRVK